MKRLGIVLIVPALFCSPLLAERIVKVEALSTDTTTFRQNKLQLNMTELAAQLVPFQGYALLAGDADGQTIQGRTGSNRARIELGITSADAMLFGSGAEPGYCGATGTAAKCSSGDVGSYLSLTNSGNGELAFGSKLMSSVSDIFQFSNMGINGEIKLQAASYIRLHGGETTPSKLTLSSDSAALESPSESNFITVSDSNVAVVAEDGVANTQFTMTSSSGLTVSSTSDGTAANSSSFQLSPLSMEVYIGNGETLHLLSDVTGTQFSSLQAFSFSSSSDGSVETTATLDVSSDGISMDIYDGITQVSIDGNGFNLSGPRFRFSAPAPTTSSDTCFAGMVAWDANFWYVCIANDTWKRTALSTW